jgi:hypothetical protein
MKRAGEQEEKTDETRIVEHCEFQVLRVTFHFQSESVGIGSLLVSRALLTSAKRTKST